MITGCVSCEIYKTDPPAPPVVGPMSGQVEVIVTGGYGPHPPGTHLYVAASKIPALTRQKKIEILKKNLPAPTG